MPRTNQEMDISREISFIYFIRRGGKENSDQMVMKQTKPYRAPNISVCVKSEVGRKPTRNVGTLEVNSKIPTSRFLQKPGLAPRVLLVTALQVTDGVRDLGQRIFTS